MPNRMERFTQRSALVLKLAQEEVECFQHREISVGHFFLGLMKCDGSVSQYVLQELGIEAKQVEDVINQFNEKNELPAEQPIISDEVKKVLEMAVGEARKRNHHYVGTEHLLLGYISHQEGQNLLNQLGVSVDEVRQKVRETMLNSSS